MYVYILTHGEAQPFALGRVRLGPSTILCLRSNHDVGSHTAWLRRQSVTSQPELQSNALIVSCSVLRIVRYHQPRFFTDRTQRLRRHNQPYRQLMGRLHLPFHPLHRRRARHLDFRGHGERSCTSSGVLHSTEGFDVGGQGGTDDTVEEGGRGFDEVKLEVGSPMTSLLWIGVVG